MMHTMQTMRSLRELGQSLGCVFLCAALSFGLLLSASPAMAADDLLANERWEDQAHGVSLRPPLGAQMLRLSADDAILRISHPSGYKITGYVKQSTQELTLNEVIKTAVDQVSMAGTPMYKVEDPRDIKLGSLQAKQFTFAAPALTPPAVISQAFAMLGPKTVLIIELNSPAKDYEAHKPAFTQMLQSFRYEDPQKQAELRKKMLENGNAWFKALTTEAIHKALVADQWFRIVDRKQDIGYMRITQKIDTALNTPGVRIDMQSRLVVDNVAYDTLSNYFVSDRRNVDSEGVTQMAEVWSVRTTARPMPGAAKNVAEASFADTGLLSKGKLSLTRESPQGKKPFEWDQLPEDYISQAHAQLLPHLLSPADKETLAFFAYYANTGKIALRTERVEVAADGTYRVYSRPSPEQQEQVSYFDAQGKLLRRSLPGGQMLIPTTAEEIANRWKLRQ